MFNDALYILDLGPRHPTEEGKMYCTLSGKIRLTNLCPIINNRGFNCLMSILKTEQKSDSKNLLFNKIKTTKK